MLLHYAQCWGNICDGAPPPEGTWQDAWAALAQAKSDGVVRAIGVSNFHVPVLQQLISFGHTLAVDGTVNLVQDWFDPLHQAAEFGSLDTCKFLLKHGASLMILNKDGLTANLADPQSMASIKDINELGKFQEVLRNMKPFLDKN